MTYDYQAEQAQLVKSLARASAAIDYLEQTGDFRFEGLTLRQWREIRDLRVAEIDATVERGVAK